VEQRTKIELMAIFDAEHKEWHAVLRKCVYAQISCSFSWGLIALHVPFKISKIAEVSRMF